MVLPAPVKNAYPLEYYRPHGGMMVFPALELLLVVFFSPRAEEQ
jgi:hypothetical protein